MIENERDGIAYAVNENGETYGPLPPGIPA